MKETEYRSENAAHGGSLEAFIAEEVDISGITTSKLFRVKDDLKGYSIIGVQAVSANLTGTLDGTIDLVESHDNINFDDTGASAVLSTADGSVTLKEVDFSGKYAGVQFTKIGITGGTITLIFIAKRK